MLKSKWPAACVNDYSHIKKSVGGPARGPFKLTGIYIDVIMDNPSKVWVKLLIHSQNSTDASLTFGDVYAILSHTRS